MSLFVLTAALGIMGCSSDPNSPNEGPVTAETMTEAQREAVLIQLETRGMDSATARFVDENVIVEEDMVLRISDLLAESKETVEKGYQYHPLFLTSANNTKLVLSGGLPPNATWAQAARTAAADWTAATWADSGGTQRDIRVSIREANTGRQTLVSAMNLSGSPFFVDPCVYAQSSFPELVFPQSLYLEPGDVTINTGFNCGGCTYANVPQATATTVMRHELGHTMGMAHPEDRNVSGVSHIPNTASGGGYLTVMHAGIGCGSSQALQSDDRASAASMFGLN
jgi:hypothetical protein